MKSEAGAEWELWPTPDLVKDHIQEYAVFFTLALALSCGMPYPSNWPKRGEDGKEKAE